MIQHLILIKKFIDYKKGMIFVVKLKWKDPLDDLSDCFDIRREVFVNEQGFSEESVFDSIDKNCHHLCVYNESDNTIIATARLFKVKNNFECGRICVLQQHRKKGIGTVIMQGIELKSMLLGATTLFIKSTFESAAFFKSIGFVIAADLQTIEASDYVEMKKSLL